MGQGSSKREANILLPCDMSNAVIVPINSISLSSFPGIDGGGWTVVAVMALESDGVLPEQAVMDELFTDETVEPLRVREWIVEWLVC